MSYSTHSVMDLLWVSSSLLRGRDQAAGPQIKVTGPQPYGGWLVPGEQRGQAAGGRHRCCESLGLLGTRKQPVRSGDSA